MITKGKTIRRLESKDLYSRVVAEMALVRFGGAVEGAPIQLSELTDGAGPEARPSPRLIQNVLEHPDIILVSLSIENFFALRLCEIRHVFRLPAVIVVQSISGYFDKYKATPFFQSFMKLGGVSLEETVQSVANQLDEYSTTFLRPEEVYETIDHYLEHASCFRWGQGSFRHGPPNRYSLEQYRSGVNPRDLQRLYEEYQEAKHDGRPMQLIMGDQYNFSHAGAVGPHSTSAQSVASANSLNELARELTLLVEHLRESKADHKSESVCVVAAAAEAAGAGDKTKALAHLTALSGDVLEPVDGWVSARKWVVDNASKIGVDLATAAIKIALGM
jgi:hypothetical protein